jgi:alcohol dehydrogenase class IV
MSANAEVLKQIWGQLVSMLESEVNHLVETDRDLNDIKLAGATLKVLKEANPSYKVEDPANPESTKEKTKDFFSKLKELMDD